jgi:hypothetical protein
VAGDDRRRAAHHRQPAPPRDEIPLALLLFNVGVEIGQLVFVAVAMLLEYGVAKDTAIKLRDAWPALEEFTGGVFTESLRDFYTYVIEKERFGTMTRPILHLNR